MNARIATLRTGTTVRVTVPGTATTGIISLTTPSGVVTTSALTPANFAVSAPSLAPTITSYAPATGQVQGGAVTITGTNFTGAKGPNVQLAWRTASEKNSARFEVERSAASMASSLPASAK